MNPNAEQENCQHTYDRLHALYKSTHDAFGLQGSQADCYPVMKELLAIREGVG